MKKIISAFVKYPFYANLIVAVFLLAGISSMLSLKKSFFPERKTTTIMVNVAYPGASPKEMEEGITTRIEESLRGLIGIKEITGVATLAGMGLTVALVIADIAARSEAELDQVRLGLFISAIISGLAGFIWLRRTPAP